MNDYSVFFTIIGVILVVYAICFLIVLKDIYAKIESIQSMNSLLNSENCRLWDSIEKVSKSVDEVSFKQKHKHAK